MTPDEESGQPGCRVYTTGERLIPDKPGKTLYQKLELMSSADEQGKYWEIRSNGETLHEADLVELADWIARELGWIRR